MAFNTDRKYTDNAEQKHILRERISLGSDDFRKKRAYQIVQTAADVAGIKLDEISGQRGEKGEGGKREK